jgi:hypothetical protein
MPGVLTYPQLRRELKQCRELGKPFPFVLAVIPSSGNQAELPVTLVPMTSNSLA